MKTGAMLRKQLRPVLDRVPFLREAYWSLKTLVSRDGAYGRRWQMLGECLTDLDGVVGEPVRPVSRRVLVFASLPWWVNVCTPMAAALAEQATVDLCWLPHDSHLPGLADRYGRWSYAQPVPKDHPRLRVIDLARVVPSLLDTRTEATVKGLSRMDAVYCGFRESWDIDRDPEGRAMYEFRLGRNRHCALAMQTLLDQNRYDAVVIPNGAILEFAVVYELARARHIPTITFERSERRDHIIACVDQQAVFNPLDELWAGDVPHTLDPERAKRVSRLMARREAPNWQDEFIWAGQLAHTRERDDLLAELDLCPDRPIALLCTNLAWDSAVIGRSAVFRTMAQWIGETAAWFAARPQYQLIVRCHPAENHYPTNEPTEGVLAARFPQLPPNLRLIRASDKVNTYGLMPLANVGIVFTSTIGIEMACRGLPTVVAGKVHYREKGFTTDPPDPASYFRAVDQALAAPLRRTRLRSRQAELAKCYLDLLYHRWPLPFPWLSDPVAKLKEWPLRRVFSPEGRARFGRTFDFLSGRAPSQPDIRPSRRARTPMPH
jgi:hypothetical protein